MGRKGEVEVFKTCAMCGMECWTADHWCDACAMKVNAVRPPLVLLDLQWIYEGGEPTNGRQEILKELKNKSPEKFLDRLQKAEHNYQMAVRDVIDKEGNLIAPGKSGLDRKDNMILKEGKAEELIEQALERCARDVESEMLPSVGSKGAQGESAVQEVDSQAVQGEFDVKGGDSGGLRK